MSVRSQQFQKKGLQYITIPTVRLLKRIAIFEQRYSDTVLSEQQKIHSSVEFPPPPPLDQRNQHVMSSAAGNAYNSRFQHFTDVTIYLKPPHPPNYYVRSIALRKTRHQGPAKFQLPNAGPSYLKMKGRNRKYITTIKSFNNISP